MARAHFVKAARKPIKEADIKKGDSYWWWKFRYGPKRASKTKPRPSQLTQSEFLSGVYALQERLEDLDAALYLEDPNSLATDLQDIASEARSIGEECDSRRENMPEALQGSETGQMLEERRDACDAWADELENISVDVADDADDEEKLAAIEAAISEAQGAEAPA